MKLGHKKMFKVFKMNKMNFLAMKMLICLFWKRLDKVLVWMGAMTLTMKKRQD